ncbi:MAG: CoA-binding protein [Desulfobacterales bacterium]
MSEGRILAQDEEIRALLTSAKTIAVVGISPKPDRDSHRVAAYLQGRGYRIIPVRPAQAEILGEKAYPSLEDIPGTVDIVDVFRRADQIPAHAEEALRLRPRAFWMQEGIEHPEAAERLRRAGIDVVMNRCIMREHARLLG